MGKPSSTQLSRKSSKNASMSKEKAKIPKISKNNRKKSKKHRKTQQSINKLFNHLRETSLNVSQNSSQTNMDDSVIELDDTQNTVISVKDQTLNEPRMQEDLIIIPDDDQKACSMPKQFSLHHSTPKKTLSLDEVILARSNNNSSIQNFNENVNLTREINRDSYLTIDLTTDTTLNRSEPTVIDLEKMDHDNDVTVVSCNISNASSMSGDSNVTVLQKPMKFRNLTKGIANLNASEKGRLLEHITKTIFNGCSVPSQLQNSTSNLQNALPRAPATVEDTYIKEVILGGKASRASINSTGSNVYHPSRQRGNKTGRRMVVIDGSNVAMEHGRHKTFSVRGLQICIDYFMRKGHVVKAFVPRFRCKYGMSTDSRLLDYLERRGLVVYTPSREVKGRTITPYDDRYIVQCAAEFDGVIVTGDNYRDLIHENGRWRFIIENRLIPFTWVDDMIMFPKDPYGRGGPSLEQLLTHGGPEPTQQRSLNIDTGTAFYLGPKSTKTMGGFP